jgi:hypothetical protein
MPDVTKMGNLVISGPGTVWLVQTYVEPNMVLKVLVDSELGNPS